MKPITLALLALLLALLFSACTVSTFPPPAPRPLSISDDQATTSDRPAIAIDGNGTVHLARVECTTTAVPKFCRVVYEVLKMGVKTLGYEYSQEGSNYTVREPDVAVSQSGGLGVITWRSCPVDSGQQRYCTSRYALSTSMTTQHWLDNGYYSLSAPLVVSRGETIYVVHEVAVGTLGSAIRYCAMSAGSITCRWASDHPNDGALRSDYAAAVSNAGALYVAWLLGDGTTRTLTYNDNVGAAGADMVNQRQIDVGNFITPAMAVESDDGYLYLAYTEHLYGAGGDTDKIRIRTCVPATCVSPVGYVDVNLPDAEHWSITFYGVPTMAANAAQASIAFEAGKTGLASSDVFLVNYAAGAAAPTPTTPYHTESTYRDCDPVVAIVDSREAIGWHLCGFPPVTNDIYFYHLGTGGIVIHDAADNAGRGGLDMAANGEFVAGAWNEAQADGRLATWLAFNSYLNYMPNLVR